MLVVIALGGNALLQRGERPDAVAQDGDRWRRVVASPVPQRIVEAATADLLLRHGTTVVWAGGGGVPVVNGEHGLEGVEAVAPKDLVAALVAEELAADLLVVLTDVSAVMVDFATPQQRPPGNVTPDDLANHAFPQGSMGPKIDAVIQFVRATGSRAAIGSLDDTAAVFVGTAGTQLRRHPQN